MREAAIFKTEGEFREWFEARLDRFGVKRIILSQEVSPYYTLEMTDGRDPSPLAEGYTFFLTVIIKGRGELSCYAS